MVKSDRKNQRHYEEQDQHPIVTCAHNQQEKEANDEDHELGRDDVGEDRAHKKPFLTLEEGEAVRAVMADVERSGNDSGFATSGTTQGQRTLQHPFNLFKICFQGW